MTVKPWIHEEIFKTWTDAQKRLWESLCSAVPLQPPTGVEAWRETYLKNLSSWEAAVQRALEQETAWVEEWVRRVAQERGTPEMMATWVQQMEDVLQRWVQTQNKWWSDYFTVLRRSRFTPTEPTGAAPPATLDVTPEEAMKPAPAAASSPEVSPPVEAAEPVAVSPVTVESATVESAPVAHAADDLKLINGIGPILEKKLNTYGITRFRDLAMLNAADIERIEAAIKFAGRIRRENWIGQAKAHDAQKYGQPL